MSDELKKLQDAQTAQGEVVRKLKAEKADKASIDAEVKKLLDLKDQVTKKAAALGVTVEAPKPAAPAAKPAAKPAAAPAAKPAEKPKEAKKEAPKPAAAAPAEKKAEPKVAAPTPAAAPVAAPAPTPAAAAPAPSKATPQDVDVKYSPKQIPLALLVAIHHLEAQVRLKQLTPTADSLTFRFGKNAFDNEISALRFLARSFPETHLYGTPFNAFTSSEVDSWIGVALTLQSKVEPTLLVQLQSVLQLRTFLVEFNLTIADLTVWSALRAHNVNLKKDYPDVFRWFNFINTHTLVTSVLTRVTGEVETDKKKSRVGAQGSFTNLELPGAEMGKVVTRFPPEPSGYLHIGHIKAALLNNYYAQHFNGKLIIRFDDTNPAKEKDEYVEAILEDLHTLGISTKNVSYTSDFFDQLIVWAEKLISMGKGYIDDTPADQMKEERGEGVVSKRRNASVEDNMKLWNEMKQATDLGKRCCLRAKIDMDSKNKCLRDPVFYRSVEQPHQRTKSKYKIYPTYDFACPIVDSLEGVTHALRSSEYHDRNALYNWVLETLKLRVVYIQDFSRLNFQYTVLSKRKLQWFVEQKMVSGWHDARFPTVRGILRRGMTVQALTEFILAQGASKTLTLMEPEKLWAINKKIIDPIVPRYMAVADGAVVLTLTNQTKSENKTVLKHRKQPELGTKVITLAPQLLIEAEDAAVVALNEEVTLMDIGNCFITKIDKDSTGKVTALTGKLHLEGDFKKTDKKLNWVAKGEDLVRVNMVDFDYLITKKKLDEEDKFEDFVNKNTKFDKFGYGDANLRSLKKGDQIQIERRGYFIVDEAYLNNTKPVVLFSIPDGHSTREASILVSKKPSAQSTTEEAKPAAPVATQTPAPAAKKEEKADELDLFGEDTEDEAREREIMKTAAEHAAKKKAAGKVAVLKSLVVIDVKPWDDTTDMKAMEEAVRSIVIEGLEWKASKLVAIGYGIKKLQISCHVVDEIVSVDDVQEKIQEFEDLVQSTDISSFSKL